MSDDLDPGLSRLLDSARGASDPTSEDRRRIRGALAAKLASGVLLTSASANAAAAAGSAGAGTLLGKGLKLVLLTQIGPGIVAGTLLGAGASFLASAASDAVMAPTDTPVSSAQVPPKTYGSPATIPPGVSVSPRFDPPSEPAAVPRPRSSQRAVVEAPLPATSAPRAAEPAVAGFPVGKIRPQAELSDELALVSRIHESWQRGDEAGVRRAVETHEQRFPRGTLVEEREAVKVMLACRYAEPARAAGLGSAFLARYPGSTHAARVVAICGVKR